MEKTSKNAIILYTVPIKFLTEIIMNHPYLQEYAMIFMLLCTTPTCLALSTSHFLFPTIPLVTSFLEKSASGTLVQMLLEKIAIPLWKLYGKQRDKLDLCLSMHPLTKSTFQQEKVTVKIYRLSFGKLKGMEEP